MSTPRPLPKRVKVGGSVYRINLVEHLRDVDGTDLFGRAHATEFLIEIEATLAIERQWQVLWHELLHVFMHNAGYHDSHNESLIDALSTQINWTLALNRWAMLPDL